jgi:hypothetical protein
MPFKSRALQRIVLAFTTGLFLACAAKVSEAGAQTPIAIVR